MKYKIILILYAVINISCGSVLPDNLKAPKREFRGVWIATVVNIDWPKAATDPIAKKKNDFLKLLDFYDAFNFNAAIVQIRTAGDAFYPSELAPWSRFLTGKEGEASTEYYGLLPWMIEETHKRGMEFHAWINPYRATFDLNTEVLSETHDYFKHPEWMIKYGKKYYYNPGIPEVQEHLVNVVREIVTKYDIDAVHFDDYFYPYRIKNEDFNDLETYKLYAAKGMPVEDWRRENINTLVKSIHDSITVTKPWVQFGISPFGVWRNASTDPRGSDTKAGQTTYDDLYADPLAWIKNEWIDYIAPQLYWSLHYPPASHVKLINWWANQRGNTKLYIGNGPYKIRNNADKAWKKKKELPNQLKRARLKPQVDGNIFFSAKSLIQKNNDVVRKLKRTIYKYPALTPQFNKTQEKINAPELMAADLENDYYSLKLKSIPDDAQYLVLYGFSSKRKIDLNTGKNILKKFHVKSKIKLAHKSLKNKRLFAATFLNHNGAESEPFLFILSTTKTGHLSVKKYTR
jgi:uncharacterized lipoprotein YddW (UPF0748 family)